jgi:hypothetical protein
MEKNEKLVPNQSSTFICIQEYLGADDLKNLISKIVDIEKIKKEKSDSYKMDLQRILVEVGSDIDIFHSSND